MKRTIAFIFFLFAFGASAQNEDVIEGFIGNAHNGKVLLSWSIIQGNTCNGVDILRSEDSVNFVEIGSIEGICGSTAEKIDYTFTDLSPLKNQTNYYRLSLGGIGFSWIIAVEVIDLNSEEYSIRPHPITSNSILHFENDSHAILALDIFDQQGHQLHSFKSSGNQTVISSDDWNAGMYFFTISEGANVRVRGKFIVP